MHPTVGILLERITPLQGVTICGQFMTGGTVVGCNAWVLHQNKEVFSEDADVYRPERWIEKEGADPARLSKMRQSMYQFGAGSRTCIGKNISLRETYKMVPRFLRKFEVSSFVQCAESFKLMLMPEQIELVESKDPMRLMNAFFVHRLNFQVRIRLRKK